MRGEHLTAADVDGYWTPDLPAEEVQRIEAHAFECADCTRRIEAAEALSRGIATIVRSGQFQAIVTDAILNRLARDGVRVRTYALEAGAVVPCAVWRDDEVVAVRLRGDFTGLDSATIVTRLDTGDEVDAQVDVPVCPTATELIQALSAARLRQLPRMHVRITVLGRRSDSAVDRVVADYVLEHSGALERSDAGPP